MSFDVFNELATDDSLEENGTWQSLGKGTELLVARNGNRAYSKMLSKSVERHQQTLDLEDDAADKLSDEIMVDVIARTVLLGWKNLSFKGQTLDYSVENAKKVLGLKEFRKRVMALASNFDAYKLKQEALQGNV